MPGLLKMGGQSVVDTPGPRKEKSQAHDDTIASEVAAMDGEQNGANGLPNGSAAGAATTNGGHADVEMQNAGPEDPPQLDQSWREADVNKSLGKMMDRLAQDAYADLTTTLNRMADLPTDTTPQTNGTSVPGQVDSSEISKQKKRLLMDYAYTQRDRFTKTLVLSDWAQNAEEMAKLIDIKVWQDKQRWATEMSRDTIGFLKRNLAVFNTPAPNIEGAMEVLATGKQAHVPDFGYIPPKRLTAKQLLRTLRNMNVAVATRLNLQEDLPYHMQDFSVASGRATFTVSGEFEVDLAVADEESGSPFYFIDFRLLFTPSSAIVNDQIRAHLEAKTNAELSSRGLKGCYDFLHNFVLTNKIVVLRRQAQEMLRGKWFDCIKPESLRRNLAVQYWKGMPGPKDWIEIGVNSGRAPGKPAARVTPSIGVRWFRKGQEVKDEVLEFDWTELDLEKCLMQVIGKHSAGKLRAARHGLRTLAASSTGLEMSISDKDDVDCALRLRLPAMRKPLVVRVEPVTGQWSLSPPGPATFDAERRLNSDPNIDASRLFAGLVCALVQERILKIAETLGWTTLRGVSNAKERLGADVLQHSIFSLAGWSPEWLLAASFGLGGEKWWVLRFRSDQPNAARTVDLARELPGTRDLGEITKSVLLGIEKRAVAEVSQAVLSHQLRSLRIPHEFEPSPPRSSDTPNPCSVAGMVAYLSFDALMRDVRDKNWKPWAHHTVRVSHHGIVPIDSPLTSNADPQTPSQVRHDLRLNIERGQLKHLESHLSKSKDQDIALNKSGGLAVRLRTPFGEPFVEAIRRRLANVERLDGYLAVLRRLGFTCTNMGLQRLAFTYCKNPELGAQITFAPTDGGDNANLKLLPQGGNPHMRSRVPLEQLLNTGARDSFQVFAQVLAFSLPVVQVLDQLEEDHLADRTAVARVRCATWFRIVYRSPLPNVILEVRTRAKVVHNEVQARWHILPVSDGKPAPDAVASALKSFCAAERGEGWFGIGNGVIADISGVKSALQKLDAVMRGLEGASDVVNKAAQENMEDKKAPPPAPTVVGDRNGNPSANANVNGQTARQMTLPPAQQRVEKPGQQQQQQHGQERQQQHLNNGRPLQQPPMNGRLGQQATKRQEKPDVIMLD